MASGIRPPALEHWRVPLAAVAWRLAPSRDLDLRRDSLAVPTLARCDPDQPLETGDSRYVDIDSASDGGSRPRRYDWVQHIARKFELASGPRMLLLTGLPGSGKSTELRRIVEKLRDPAGAALFPVLIDADKTIDLRAPLDLPELILTILVETERRIMIDLEGCEPDRVDDAIGQDSVAARLWTWLSTTEVELNQFDIGVHGQQLTLELKRNPSFKQQVRATVKHRLSDFLQQARRYMAELEARAKRYELARTEPTIRYAGVIVVLDSLEKLRGLSSNAVEVLESAEYVFRTLDPADLGVHISSRSPPRSLPVVTSTSSSCPSSKSGTKTASITSQVNKRCDR